MIKTNSKLLLASTALVSAVAVAGVAQAADTAVLTSGALTTTSAAQLTLTDADSSSSVTSGDTVSTDSDIAAELITGNTGNVITVDTAGLTVNIAHDVSTSAAAASTISVTENTTLNIGSTVTVSNTDAGGVIDLATGTTSTLNIHGDLAADTVDAITGSGTSAITANIAGDVSGSITTGSGTNAINLTNGMTLTGGITASAGTSDTLVVNDLSIDTSGTAVSYSAGTVSVTGAIASVETINVQAGTLDVDGAISGATDVSVSSGAHLDIASTLAVTNLAVAGSLTTAGGAITGNATFSSGSEVIGAYQMGATSHTLVSNGATFGSTITGGAGNDTFTINASTTSGKLDGAAGSDTLTVAGGTYTVAGVDNVETINVTGGTLKSSDALGATVLTDLTVSSGAEVSVTGAVTVTDDLIIAGTFGASGAVAVTDDISVSGSMDVNTNSTAADLFVTSTGAVNLDANLTMSGALAASGSVVVNNGATLSAATGQTYLKNVTLQLTDADNTSGALTFTGEDVDMTTNQIKLAVAPGVTLTDGRVYDSIVDGQTTAVSKTGGTNIVTGNAIYKYTWTTDGDAYDLLVNLKTAGVTTLEGAVTAPYKGIAAEFDNVTTSSVQSLQDLYRQVFAETNTASTLESLQPDVTGGAAAASINSSVASTGAVSNRLALLRGTDNGRSGAVAGDEMMQNRGMWIQAFGTTADQDERDGVKGFDATTGGFAIGVDSDDLVENSRVGVAVSYAKSDIDSDASNNAQTDIDTYQLTVYGSHDYENGMYLDGMVAYAWNDNETERTDFLNNRYKGDFDGSQISVKAEVGKSYDWKDAKVTPNAGIHYINVDSDSYNETGAGAGALSVDNDDVTAVLLSVGADMEWNVTGNNGSVYKPYVRAKYSYDAQGDEVVATSTFLAGGSAFKSTGADVERSSFNLGTGVNIMTTGGMEFSAAYDAELKKDYLAHTGVLQARWKF